MSEACLEKARYGGIEAIPTATDQCYEMTPPQRWRGVWIDAFENQRFCPAPAQTCSDESAGPHIWIEFEGDKRPVDGPANGKTYQIEFIGRQTVEVGPHGHFGTSEHAILVDRLISIVPAQNGS